VLVFPFIRHDLNDLLQDKKLSALQIQKCLKDLFTALEFIHSQGIIHRDVKPSNILLRSLEGPAYLSDFGIAWSPTVLGSEATDSKITDVGTTCYRPPELLFGNTHYGCSLDLWAAGCTAAEALDPEHATLFDSGELGSDLALIQSIFKKLGTPNLDVWPVCWRAAIRYSANPNRRRKAFGTGVRCSSTSILRKSGLHCYQTSRKTAVIS
jgi:serine/threonine protein kinase